MIHLKDCTGHWREDKQRMCNCNCRARVLEHDRALAERVREAIAKRFDAGELAGRWLARGIRELDLDALLEET